jgi:hypothetical protein
MRSSGDWNYRSVNTSILEHILCNVIVGGDPESLGNSIVPLSPSEVTRSSLCKTSVAISILVIGVNGVLNAIRTKS